MNTYVLMFFAAAVVLLIGLAVLRPRDTGKKKRDGGPDGSDVLLFGDSGDGGGGDGGD